jgi:hypothetical protein
MMMMMKYQEEFVPFPTLVTPLEPALGLALKPIIPHVSGMLIMVVPGPRPTAMNGGAVPRLHALFGAFK